MKRLWEHAQDRQKMKLQLCSNELQRKIDAWKKYQVLYYPGVQRFRKESDAQVDFKPHEHPLWLPSQIGVQIHIPDLL